MASGVSGRVSVSPPIDEAYQSPGASQDDGIDRMLARYSGLVEREKEGEEEREGGSKAMARKKGGSGGEPGMQRNHPKGGAGASELSPITIGPGNPQSTLLTLTPSPRHAASAPVSQQTTPAHDSEGPAEGGATGQAGFSGDVRSFSWDHLASGAAAAAETKGNYVMHVREHVTGSFVVVYTLHWGCTINRLLMQRALFCG